jgi:hypothetical protein
VGVAYDLFGNGRTAVKASVARYVQPEATGIAASADPQATIGRTDTRTWQNLDGSYTIYNPDGSVKFNELGPSTNLNFGKVNPNATTIDPATLNGFNARTSTVEYQGVVQHQLSSRVSVTGDYYYRYLGNLLATNNLFVSRADYGSPFCITAPLSPQLPGGGGYPVCGLYDINPQKLGQIHNYVTLARDTGGIVDHFMGFDIGFNARFGAATFVQGGLNAQRQLYDDCNAPILSGTTVNQVYSPEGQFCHQIFPYRPDLKFFGSHTFPHGVIVAATYQLSTGPNITATWNAPNSVIAPALGRNLAAGATATKSVQLIAPGTLWSGYLNQLDLRLAKAFTVGRYRLRAEANLYNVFNSDFVNSVNTTFSTTASNQFLRPTNVLQGRLFKVGGQVEF